MTDKPTARELAEWVQNWARAQEHPQERLFVVAAELTRLAEIAAEDEVLREQNLAMNAELVELHKERDRLREALRGLADYLDECAAIEDNDPDVCAELRIKAAEAREKAEGR